MDVTKFEELQLDDRIIRAITEMGFEEASPIQAQAIPDFRSSLTACIST